MSSVRFVEHRPLEGNVAIRPEVVANAGQHLVPCPASRDVIEHDVKALQLVVLSPIVPVSGPEAVLALSGLTVT